VVSWKKFRFYFKRRCKIPKHIWENDNFLKKLKSAVEVERMSLDERLAYELSLSVERDWYACMEYRYEEEVEKL